MAYTRDGYLEGQVSGGDRVLIDEDISVYLMWINGTFRPTERVAISMYPNRERRGQVSLHWKCQLDRRLIVTLTLS